MNKTAIFNIVAFILLAGLVILIALTPKDKRPEQCEKLGGHWSGRQCIEGKVIVLP